MAGQMGGITVTTQNLTVHAVDAEKGLVLLKGAVPGPKGGLVLIRSAAKKGAGPVTREQASSVDLPAELFDVQVNIPLIHQVVVAQLAARVRARTPPRPAARSAVVAASPTGRRAPAAPARARPGRRSSPAVASSTARCRAATTSAPRRR